jgi:peptide/nickel transport system ATP-binding protein
MMRPLLEFREVSKTFAARLLTRYNIKAVDRVSFEVNKDEIIGILGESGSGKSTIAKLILKVIKPTSGQILFKGRDIWEINEREYYRYVQGVFQDPFSSFNPRRRIIDIFRDTIINTSNEKIKNHEEVIEIIRPIFEKIGLDPRDIIEKYPHEFSGGQLQRLSIARALLVRPELIVADEPVSMVDASTRIDILNIFIDLKKTTNLTSIIIGHDLALTSYVSDRVIVLYRGQIVEEGSVDILKDPAHPYTKMLSESIPRIDKKWESHLKYKAFETSNIKTSRGCIFASRCPYKKEICENKEPPYVQLGKSRVRCWLYAEK